jgi:hypothetical protein
MVMIIMSAVHSVLINCLGFSNYSVLKFPPTVLELLYFNLQVVIYIKHLLDIV